MVDLLAIDAAVKAGPSQFEPAQQPHERNAGLCRKGQLACMTDVCAEIAMMPTVTLAGFWAGCWPTLATLPVNSEPV
jgi:hypothetical protein